MHGELAALTKVLDDRFAEILRALPGPTPRHRVSFSRRITTAWALIYYRRHLVRLSPYLFLLDEDELHHGSHWRELDATLRHEAVHAHLYARMGETGHSAAFHALLARLGVSPNGGCDLGPENVAFRYRYGCRSCGREWRRRVPLRGNWSCGTCAPGRYVPELRLELLAREDPWARLRQRRPWILRALEEARSREPLRPVAPPLAARRLD